MQIDHIVSRLKTLNQAADFKNISSELLFHYVKNDRGPKFYRIGRYYVFDIEDLNAWNKDDHQAERGRPKRS